MSGTLFLTPVRAGTGVNVYGNVPVEDLTSIDYAANGNYPTSGVEALPGWGYVFEMDGGDGFFRYGAVRVTHGPELPDPGLGLPDRSGESGADSGAR